MKKFILNLISDIKNIKFFFSINTKDKICIFNENENTFQYLEYYLNNKNKRKIIFFSLKKINYNFHKNVDLIYLNFNFFIEIFFLFLKSKYIYSTTPGLNSTIFKKSVFSKNSKYIYIQHSPVSLVMAYDRKAFVEFDAIQTINSFQYREVKQINNLYSKKIKPFKSKYRFLKYKKDQHNKDLLIAPTWKTNFYSSGFYLILFHKLINKNINFEFRPHYMSLKNKEFDMGNLDFIKNKIDTSPTLKLSDYKNLVSDWSGIYLEFLILKRRKPYLFNSKKKILNSDYNLKFGLSSIEEYTRDKICLTYNFDQVDFFIKDIINKENENYENKDVNQFLKENFYI